MDNEFKNVLSRILVIVLLILVAIYLATLLFVVAAYGPSYIQLNKPGPEYLARNFSVVSFLFKEIAYYFSWMIDHKRIVSLTANNFFVLKLFGIPLLVFIATALIIYFRYGALQDWQPFKVKEKLHGDARWASQEDINKAGLRAKSGILLGKDGRGYFVAAGFQHALLFAPTGSGKGVGFVIPNLLFWEESCLVHDVKLENHEYTSGWRESIGHKCYVWAPAQPDGITHCYNPMDWISSKPGQMVDDVQKISNFVLPKQEFWENEARSIFMAVVLYLLAVPERVTSFGEVVRVMRSDDVAYNLAVVLDTIGKYIHPVAYMNIAAFLQKADKERSGVISTLNSGLELWANPLIDTATATSDFNFGKMKKEKITVFIGVTPDNLTRLQRLMQIFYQQASDILTRKLPDDKTEPYGVLFLLDEFPTLGKMEIIRSGIAYFRGYRVRLFLIIQDTQQLKAIYEEAGMNSFLSNSTFRVTFAANNVETANLISQLCGNKTVEAVSQSKPKFLDFNPASRSMNVSEAQRALLLPQEVIMLPRDEQIVIIESFPPMKSKKIRWYEDSFFKSRILPPSSIPTQEPYDPSKLGSESSDNTDTKSEEKTDEEED